MDRRPDVGDDENSLLSFSFLGWAKGSGLYCKTLSAPRYLDAMSLHHKDFCFTRGIGVEGSS